MGRGVFRKIIKQPVDAERLKKKTARMSGAELIERDVKEQIEEIRELFGLDSQKKADALVAEADASKNIASSVEKQIATDAAEPSPDADRPKSAWPVSDTVRGSGVGTGQSGSSSSGRKRAPEVYGDVEVCRLLKIRRRKIAEARTKATRGVDWDCVGLHAGMTKKWIQETAIKQGIVPDFFNVPLTAIKQGDGIVSCKLLGTWPNRTKVTVEIVATGEAKVATVRDANEFHLYDIFDAKDYGREIQWTAELNNAIY